MKSKPDLHVHTTASDGVLDPLSLARRAAELGVTHLAVTDHDTMDGYDLAAQAKLSLTLLPGVELSMQDMPELHSLHLLGYGWGRAEHLRHVLNDLARKRIDRARIMMEKLAAMGMPLPEDDIIRSCGGTVGRPHIARAMIRAGYVADLPEAFERYLAKGKPAYQPGERLAMTQALSLLRDEGFIPVLAHPCELRVEDIRLRALLREWKKCGLLGMEVYHPSAAARGFVQLDRLARSLGLLVTGGSDFHQDHDRHAMVGAMAAYWNNADEDLHCLLEAMDKNRQL